MAGAKNRFGFTEDEMESLTDAERAAIMDEDTLEPGDVVGTGELDEPAAAADPEAEPAAAKVEKPEADADADKDDPEPAAEPKPEDVQDPAKKEPVPADPAAAATPEPVQEPAPRPAPRANPVPRYQVPADAEAKLTGFDNKLDEIAQKFDDGEITAAEMRQQERDIQRQRDELREKMMLAKVAQGFTVSQWADHEVPTFLAQHPEYEPGSLRYQLLDDLVRQQQVANPGNEFDPSYLTNAHTRIVQELGEIGGQPTPAAAKPAATTEPRPGLPPTLRGVPASDISPTDDGGKFAALDRLQKENLEAFEAKLAAMSPEEQDRYLQANT